MLLTVIVTAGADGSERLSAAMDVVPVVEEQPSVYFDSASIAFTSELHVPSARTGSVSVSEASQVSLLVDDGPSPHRDSGTKNCSSICTFFSELSLIGTFDASRHNLTKPEN